MKSAIKNQTWSPDLERIPLQIELAFRELRSKGFFAEAEHWCCQTCGWYSVPATAEDVVFYHDQDGERLANKGWCYLSYRGDRIDFAAQIRSHYCDRSLFGWRL